MAQPERARQVEEHWTVPVTCPCCKKCWLHAKWLVQGRRVCLYGGPFLGYQQTEASIGPAG